MQTSIFRRVFALAVMAGWGASFHGVMDAVTRQQSSGQSLRYWLFSVCLFLLAALAARQERGPRVAYAVVRWAGSVAAAFLMVLFAYCLSTGGPISNATVGAVLQTDGVEAVQFIINDMLTPRYFIFCGAGFALTFAALSVAGSHLFLPGLGVFPRRALMGVLVFGVVFLPYHFRLVSNYFRALSTYKRELAVFRDMTELRRQMRSDAVKEGKGEIYVMVIGESAGRDFMQAYGADVENTPWMWRMESDPGWVRFTDAYSSAVYTVPAVVGALEEGNGYTGFMFPRSITLLDACRAAGMRTIWLSNQTRYARFGTPITVIAETADLVRFTNAGMGGIAESPQDTLLLPEFDKALASLGPEDNALIVLHIVGSHFPYAATLAPGAPRLPMPAGWSAQGEGSLLHTRISDYVSSLLQTDAFLETLHGKLLPFAGERPVTLVYFSDHGEDPRPGAGHNEDIFTWPMARIPCTVWCSPLFVERYGERFEQLRVNADRVFTNDLIFNLVTGLAGITYPGRDASLDIGSSAYGVTAETASITGGTRYIRDDPWLTGEEEGLAGFFAPASGVPAAAK